MRDENMSTQYGSTGQQVDMGNHWLLRLVAIIIDSIIWSIVAYIIIWVLFFRPGAGWVAWYGFGSWLILPFIMGIFWVIYSAVLEGGSWQATLGKKVMGLKVQMLDGSKAPMGKTFIRNLSKIYGLILLIDWLIGIATPGPDPRQRYFDRIAGTTVVSVKQAFGTVAPPPPPPPPS
jgi:uncharacterized RDD family membrane protein YckC